MSKRSNSPLDALLDSSSASATAAALDLPILAKRTRSAAAAAAAGGPTPSASTAAAAGAPLPFPVGVTFSTKDSAQQLGYSMGGLEVAGVVGGYRMARATDGVFSGNWYWEAEILADEEEEEAAKDGGEWKGEEQEEDGDGPREGEGAQGQGNGNDDGGASAPHFRLGWALRQADTQAPCGYDKNSYAYRDLDGAKVHKSLREDGYGEPYGPGDVIGFGICLPILPEHMQELSALNGGVLPSYVRGAEDNGTRAIGAAAEDALLGASGAGADGGGPKPEAGGPGQEEQDAWRKELEDLGNHIRFFKNGKDQGPAYQQLIGAKYYPAVSLYMGGKVRANFGPSWICDPGTTQGSSCRIDFRPISALKEPLKKEELAAYLAFIEGRRAAWRARRAGGEGKGEGVVVEQREGRATPK